jgi:signal peptidase I
MHARGRRRGVPDIDPDGSPGSIPRAPRAGGAVRPYTADLVSRRPWGCLFEIVETLVLTLLIFLVIQNFVAQPYRVQQQSMEHTLEPEQYVLVDKLTPHFGPYSRGDIVVFNPPPSWSQQADGTPYIKRVVGVGGDTVEIQDDGSVWVNGTKLVEPYLFAVDGQAQPTVASGQNRWVVPASDLFVMGDHREKSADSRAFGTIPVSAVIGRAWLRYWPFDTFGVLTTPSHPELASPAP